MSKAHHSRVNNPNLETIKKDWKGNPLTKKGRFIHHEYPDLPKVSKILQWKLRGNSNLKEKRADRFRLKTSHPDEYFNSNADGIVWLGHASFLLRIQGVSFLIDPVFGSPIFFMKRFVPFPFDPDLMKDIDYLMVSHDHRDHCDKKSLKRVGRNNPQAKVLTGLRMTGLLNSFFSNKVEEAGWYQKYQIADGINITFLPTRHWCKRTLNDTNKRLWGSFLFETEDQKIYFGGDSGYGNHYKEMNEMFGPIDYSILGIGAYKPEWFMHQSHCSPKDALKAAADLQTKNMIPMHYGAFDLSDESIGDPIRSLKSEHEKIRSQITLHDLIPGQFLKV